MQPSSKQRDKRERRSDVDQFLYPWEYRLDRLITPFEEFIQKQTTSGIILMFTAFLVLLVANSPLRELYQNIISVPISIGIGKWTIRLSFLQWMNEGFISFFFFVVGLEIKREMIVGELADIRRAALPVIAAVGGMITPALLYFLLNSTGEYARGWGIPMATDIAFCVSVLVLLGRRIPRELVMFLVTLAIVDDLGAVIVIALFYTKQIDILALGFAVTSFIILISFNIAGVRRGLPYLLLGILLWYFLLHSGVDAAMSGILAALCIPARARYNQNAFVVRIRKLIKLFQSTHRKGESILSNIEQHSILHDLDKEIRLAETPLQRMLDILHLPTALLVIPAFAIANAGIPVDFRFFGEAISHPVTSGVVFSQIVGKFVGITAFTLLGIRFGLALPHGIEKYHIAGIGILGGIGFTMSMFIADLSFPDQPQTLIMAKTGIFLASVISGIIGYLWLRIPSDLKKRA